jgi:hypothetical protein
MRTTLFWVATPCSSETDVSEGRVASVLRVREYAKKKGEENRVLLAACFLLGFLFDSEDVGHKFKVGILYELNGFTMRKKALFV